METTTCQPSRRLAVWAAPASGRPEAPLCLDAGVMQSRVSAGRSAMDRPHPHCRVPKSGPRNARVYLPRAP